MTHISISNFEIAKLFGLKYIGECEYVDKWGDAGYAYDFSFHNKAIRVNSGYGDDEAVDEQEAKEEAAKQVLILIGNVVAVLDGTIVRNK